MKNHFQNDICLYRLVVAVLGLTVLALSGLSTPEMVVAPGSAAIGGLPLR